MKKKVIIVFVLFIIASIFYIKLRRSDGINLQPLKEFAVKCKPCEEEAQRNKVNDLKYFKCSSPPEPSEKVSYILNKSIINDDYKKSVLLIILKLYTFQKNNYNQSFEMRAEPFIVNRLKNKYVVTKAFCEIIGDSHVSKITGGEYLDATNALEYLDKNPVLKQDPYIKEQLKLIEISIKDRKPLSIITNK